MNILLEMTTITTPTLENVIAKSNESIAKSNDIIAKSRSLRMKVRAATKRALRFIEEVKKYNEASLVVMKQILILISKEVSGKRKDKRKTYFIQIPWGKEVNIDEYGTEDEFDRFLIHDEEGTWIEDVADVMDLPLKEDDDGDTYTYIYESEMASFHEELEPVNAAQ